MASKSPIHDVGIVSALHALEEASRVPNVQSKDLKSIFGRENWSTGCNPDLLEILSGKRGRMEIVEAGMISRLSTAVHELDTMSSILKHLSDVATELRQEYMEIFDPLVSRLSKISRLPDEVLAMAFKSAVRAEGHRGGEQARRLSHVSRRFRAIALAECELWTTLCSSSSRKELEMLVSRYGTQADLHIFIHIPTFFPPWDFVKICSQFFSRWNTMQIGNFPRGHHPDPVVGIDPGVGLNDPISHEMRILMNAFGAGLSSLPHLQALDIQCMHHGTSSCSLPWEAPSLQLLRCAQYLPSPSVALSSVTAFVCVLHLKKCFEVRGKMQDLLDLLASLTSLTDFELDLYNTDVGSEDEKPRSPSSGCPSIKKFCLRLPTFNIYGGRHSVVGRFLVALRFPNLEDYSVSIELMDVGGDNNKRLGRLERFSSELLPYEFGRNFPCLATLTMRISFVTSHDGAPGPQEQTPVIFPIYIDNVPTVSTLNVTTRSCMVLIRDSHAAIEERYPQERVTPIQHRPIQLREIRFHNCEEMVIGDLQKIFDSMKKDGYWDALDGIAVEDCKLLEYEDARQVLGEKNLLYSQTM
ncbi:hypothetical protein SCHPADRAFT_895517 [Schizopora paradoxa]|uniref:Uncharacterized protein n=1 Tax=Schizopora paradoxa TaxID=27342 RepID=A0A0H2R3D1_9AGAM|nr:hypothetical protein SCHPADRAFT_895517 [Schizopora paradoxa]